MPGTILRFADVFGIILRDQKVEAFSDGVFAVAMTLLIYQVEPPDFAEGKTNSELLNELGKLWPYYISLFTSFFTILIMWINHHGIFKMVHRIDRRFMFANGFLLFLVPIVPYPTLMVSEFLLTPSANVARAAYAGVFGIINVAYNWLWYSASHNRTLRISNISEQQIRIITRQYLFGFPMYLLAFAAAFINIYSSLAICMLL